MTNIARRIAELFHIRVHKLLDRAEDPREVLDYSYNKQLELLQQVRRGVADVATSRKRVELQMNQLRQSNRVIMGRCTWGSKRPSAALSGWPRSTRPAPGAARG